MPGPNKEMARVARNLIRENEDVRLTVKALEARGVLRRKAELEIGRAFLCGGGINLSGEPMRFSGCKWLIWLISEAGSRAPSESRNVYTCSEVPCGVTIGLTERIE